MPTKTPLQPVIHSPVDRGSYIIEKVYFESAPGLFVTGNLYRPKNIAKDQKVPAVLFAHGHRVDARLHLDDDSIVRKNISIGAERFQRGGKSSFQALPNQLAKMGCIVWQWDMLSDSDAKQFTAEVIHRFAKQRPDMNTTKDWGLYSPQAEAHLQNVMGLHTWNAIRGLDFVLSLPEVDPQRVAITGASGGGTQTMLLAAIDDRIQLSFPVVMVSTAMQGGCTCENASLLRINTGNVEFAALFAPKPQGMNTADDWTRELATKGFPELQQLYAAYHATDKLFLQRGEIFPHAYNSITRSAFYTFLNKHFKLGFESPVIEEDFEPLPRDELTVWNEQHPAPNQNGPKFEKALLRWFHEDAQQQLKQPEALQLYIAPALESMITRNYAHAGEVIWDLEMKLDRNDHLEMHGTLSNVTHQEIVKTTWLYPKSGSKRVVIWLGEQGRKSLRDANGQLLPAVKKHLQKGHIVVGADLLFQNDKPLDSVNRTVENPREFAGYTYGYNPTLFAQRTHDLLTLVRFLRYSKVGNHPNPETVDIIANGNTGPIALAARALIGKDVNHLVAETRGFRFASLLDYKHPLFLPGAAKYLDLPGMIALNAPHPVLLIGEERAKDISDQPALTKPTDAGPSDETILRWLTTDEMR